jgi:hypothetical protein
MRNPEISMNKDSEHAGLDEPDILTGRFDEVGSADIIGTGTK